MNNNTSNKEHEMNKPKTSLSRRSLQWLAVVPALFIPGVRRWLVASMKQDRAHQVEYQRYLNRQ